MKNKVKNILNKVKLFLIKFLRKNWDILLLNIIIFILTVGIQGIYYNYLNFLMCILALIYILVPTIIINKKRNMETKKLLVAAPTLYVLFLIFLGFCTRRELYGISKLAHDTAPNFIDALIVVFIFVAFEYLGLKLSGKKKISEKKN